MDEVGGIRPGEGGRYLAGHGERDPGDNLSPGQAFVAAISGIAAGPPYDGAGEWDTIESWAASFRAASVAEVSASREPFGEVRPCPVRGAGQIQWLLEPLARDMSIRDNQGTVLFVANTGSLESIVASRQVGCAQDSGIHDTEQGSSYMSVRIRLATGLDREGIRGVYLRAFPVDECRLVAALAANLLSEETEPETISLVAELAGDVVGHIAFSPVTADTNKNWLGYILAPLGVNPECQNEGIGSQLVEHGMELVSKKSANVVLVYGDPRYYGKFGFSAEAARQFIPPCELKYPFGWQARVLHDWEPRDPSIKLSCVQSLFNPDLW